MDTCSKNKAMYDMTARPRIGPFYIGDDYEIIICDDYIEVCPIEGVPVEGKLRNHPEMFEKIIKHIRPYKDVEKYNRYDSAPRGRVVHYSDENRYEVYLDKCHAQNLKVQSNIKNAFNLPSEKTKFYSDDHYTCINCRK